MRGLTDESGSLTGTASYDAFGSVTSQSGATSTFGYTGEQTDQAGNLYLRARTYDAETGRFLSADVVQPNAPGTQGFNRYPYVANNPTTWTDPTGHQVASQVWRPVLNPAWLSIGIQLGMQFVAQACAAFPPRCFTSLGAIGLAVIIILAIMICVLDTSGPCWMLISSLTKTDTSTGTGTKPQTDPKPSPIPDQYVPPVPVPTPDREEDDPCKKAAEDASATGVTPALIGDHIEPVHGPGSKIQRVGRFNQRAWDNVENLIRQTLDYPNGVGPNPEYWQRADCMAFLDVGYIIGRDRDGNPTSVIEVYFDFNGYIRTAFPA